jgi:hypothetical protein
MDAGVSVPLIARTSKRTASTATGKRSVLVGTMSQGLRTAVEKRYDARVKMVVALRSTSSSVLELKEGHLMVIVAVLFSFTKRSKNGKRATISRPIQEIGRK